MKPTEYKAREHLRSKMGSSRSTLLGIWLLQWLTTTICGDNLGKWFSNGIFHSHNKKNWNISLSSTHNDFKLFLAILFSFKCNHLFIHVGLFAVSTITLAFRWNLKILFHSNFFMVTLCGKVDTKTFWPSYVYAFTACCTLYT